MLIDHIAFFFLPAESLLWKVGRYIGRLAFPIFCFLIVEGFFRTKNLKKYFLRLGILAVVSEAAFDFAFSADFLNFRENFRNQSVIITLIIGLLAITLIDRAKMKYLVPAPMTYNVLASIVILLACATGFFFRSDYDVFGILLIICLYYFRPQKLFCAIAFVVLCLLFDYVPQYEIVGVAAFIPIYFFNGEKGCDDRHLFYLFYPLHLAVIGLVCMLVK